MTATGRHEPGTGGGILALTAAAGEQLQLCQLAHVPSGHLVSPPPGQSQCRNVFFVFHLTKITVGLGPGTAGWAGLRSNFSVVSPTSRSSYLTPVDPPDSLYRTLKLIKRGNRIFLSSQAEGQFLRVMC